MRELRGVMRGVWRGIFVESEIEQEGWKSRGSVD